jgi:hypothetical protein
MNKITLCNEISFELLSSKISENVSGVKSLLKFALSQMNLIKIIN